MNLSSLLAGGVDKVIDSVGTAIDKLVTSDAERITLHNALKEAKINATLQNESNILKHEQEITKRWQSDNENLLTRLVRPSMVVWSFTLFTFVVLADGNVGEFTIKKEYIPIISTIVVTTVLAYMGSRGSEKIAATLKGIK